MANYKKRNLWPTLPLSVVTMMAVLLVVCFGVYLKKNSFHTRLHRFYYLTKLILIIGIVLLYIFFLVFVAIGAGMAIEITNDRERSLIIIIVIIWIIVGIFCVPFYFINLYWTYYMFQLITQQIKVPVEHKDAPYCDREIAPRAESSLYLRLQPPLELPLHPRSAPSPPAAAETDAQPSPAVYEQSTKETSN